MQITAEVTRVASVQVQEALDPEELCLGVAFQTEELCPEAAFQTEELYLEAAFQTEDSRL